MAETKMLLGSLLAHVSERARASGAFENVEVSARRVQCAAKGSGAPAWYRVDADLGRLWVSLVTADRWLSQSIEADLVHTGDSIGDLLEEEVVDLGGPRGKVLFEHFRSEDKLFTFRTSVASIGADGRVSGCDGESAARMLLAYEACFRRLGDMNAEGDEE